MTVLAFAILARDRAGRRAPSSRGRSCRAAQDARALCAGRRGDRVRAGHRRRAVSLLLGQPQLAVRTLQGSNARDLNALIGRLSIAVREHPADPRGWTLLGQAYFTAHDPAGRGEGVRARHRGGARRAGERCSFLYSAYGEALTRASAGAVTPEAEAAFDQALAIDPKDQAARYYLGLAEAARGNGPAALKYWNSLLADLPPNSPVRADLVDRIAALTARGGGAAPGHRRDGRGAGSAAESQSRRPGRLAAPGSRLCRARRQGQRARSAQRCAQGGRRARRSTRRARCRSRKHWVL